MATLSSNFGVTDRLVTPPNVPPFRFKTHKDRTDVFISKQISEQGTWEPLETEIVCRLLHVFSTFLDLGANIRWYTAIAQRILPRQARIYAFEPEPGNFRLLKANTRRIGWWWPATRIVRAALSDWVGTTDIHLSSFNQGDHRIYAWDAGHPSSQIAVTTIDAYFKNQSLPPLLLKSDTQGSEPRILRGARRALSTNLGRSALIIEFWPHGVEASGESVERFVDDLAKLPHHPFVIDNDKGQLRRAEWESLAARCKQDLAPATRTFVDLVLLAPGSDAMRAVRDLIV